MNKQGRILIIDDEEVVLNSCMAILAGSDYEVSTASNGAQGLKKIKVFMPDLVFLDLKMPGIPGMEVLEKIQAIDPTIVTIVITGFATVGSAVEAMKQGAYDFLPKPFTPAEFRMITARGLEKRRLLLETISLRREKELLRKNFAAIVSHELKSPLSAVQQNLYVLEAQLSPQMNNEQREKIVRMKGRLDGLLELIRTWLRAISEDIETISERFTPLVIEDVIKISLETVEQHAIRKNIEIRSSVKHPGIRVFGDEGTLNEVFVNILDNSIKYSHPGAIVELAVDEQNDQVIVAVSDSGIGVSEGELPYIFGDFYRGKDGGDQKGHGLGLALSRRIVELHGGTITASSAQGEGSIFKVILPAFRSDENDPLTVPDDVSLSPEQGVRQ